MPSIWEQTGETGSTFTDGPYTLGVEFTAAVAGGTIDGVWFYQTAANPGGNHTAGLWRVSDQALLGSGTASTASGAGWRYIALSAPVAIDASTAYRAGVLIESGDGYLSDAFHGWPVTNGDLTADAGYFVSSGTLAYPDSQFNDSNYWRDVEFTTVVPSQDLEGSQWFEDDGTESAATTRETQDAATTLAPDEAATLRVLIDTVATLAAGAQITLQVKQQADPDAEFDTIAVP